MLSCGFRHGARGSERGRDASSATRAACPSCDPPSGPDPLHWPGGDWEGTGVAAPCEKRAAPGIAMQQQLPAPDSGDRILIARRLRRTLLGGVVTSSSFPLPLLFFFLFLGYISLTLRERIVGFWHL
jgi:hypothetical protein